MIQQMHPNRTYDEIAVGDSAQVVRTLTANDLVVFAHASGNLNPIHMPSAPGVQSVVAEGEKEAVAPSAWVAGLVSCVLGMQLPGPGTLYRSQSLTFHGRVHVGEEVTVSVRVLAKESGRLVRLATAVTGRSCRGRWCR